MASTTASQPILTRQSTPNQNVGLRTSARSTTVSVFTDLLATRASGPHPFPFRTRSLSPTAPMVLRSRDRGRVGRRRRLCEPSPLDRGLGSFFWYLKGPSLRRWVLRLSDGHGSCSVRCQCETDCSSALWSSLASSTPPEEGASGWLQRRSRHSSTPLRPPTTKRASTCAAWLA